MMEYEWDIAKAELNLEKHGLDFQDAHIVLESDGSTTFDDTKHSLIELRYITLGFLRDGLCAVVVHTMRGGKIRIISFRPANKKERQEYGKNG